MRLKSFYGTNLTEAMRTVREALGENAIIVATREEENGGIRVTAAIDEIRPDETQASLIEPPEGSEALEQIAEALTRHLVPSYLAEKLMASATQFASDDPLVSLGAAIDAHCKFIPPSEDKPLMLIGPPGAGKTLTVAKMATRTALAKKQSTVISTDIDRAGGLEQLAAFTRLLKLNLVEIEDCHALRDIVLIQKGHPVYIDTPGRNPFNAGHRQFLRDFTAVVGEATLVLPAGLDSSEAIDMAAEFHSIGAARLLITRLDTVKRIGSLLRLAYECRLPLTGYCASSNVTEPPLPLNPVVLARLLLKGVGIQDSGFGEEKKKVSAS